MGEDRHVASTPAPGAREFPTWALAALAGVAGLASLGWMLGSLWSFVNGMSVLLYDGIMALLVGLSAGGYGYAALRPLLPAKTPAPLVVATAVAVGLAILSIAVLIVGSVLGGALTAAVWWPVIGVGVVAAGVQAHRPTRGLRIPPRLDLRSGVWALLAAAAGFWLAGALMPAGWIGNLTMDAYDVLEYHLQLPREYYQAGRVSTLTHNVYSHYPLGTEMLFLLGMCLRGGPYEGMYLAKLLHGLFGAVAVVAVAAGVCERRAPAGNMASGNGEDMRARAAAVLLATAPWVLYLSWLAMAELAQLCYLALALAWLRHWLARPTARSAAIIGIACGAACGAKYLSVGLIAAPVLVVMGGAAWTSARRWRQVLLAGGVALAAFSPWLIRNAATTGNPVFPLATGVFGRGHWDAQAARRWRDGHSPERRPPVPPPPDYRPGPPGPSRLQHLAEFCFGRPPHHADPPVTAAVMILLAGTFLAMALRPRSTPAWDWALLAVLALQVAAWAAWTRDMPGRFISISLAPICLLAGGGLSRLARVGDLPLLGRVSGGGRFSGLAPAAVLLVASAGWNLAWARRYWRIENIGWIQPGQPVVLPAGIPGNVFGRQLRYYRSANALPEGARVLLVGEARAFYFPPHTAYATLFDPQPIAAALAGDAPPREVVRRLRRMGVTHVFVAWAEIVRLSRTYGWPADLRPERLRRALSACAIADHVRYGQPATATATTSAPADGRPWVFTLYAVPPPADATAPATAPDRDVGQRPPGR